jgi:hypothetical protein
VVTETSDEEDEFISRAVICWLLLVTLSFILGLFFFNLLPGADATTWNVGILTNLGMAVAVGALLGWRRQWVQVFVAVTFGAIVTILGLDLLLLDPPPTKSPQWGFLGVGLFDSVALLIALIGMAILVGLGAVAGRLSHAAVSRCRCFAMLKSTLQRGWRSEPFRHNHMRGITLSAQ